MDERVSSSRRAWEAAPNDSATASNYLTACDRARQPLVEKARNQLLKVIHADRIPENLRDIFDQYQSNRNRLRQFGIVTVPEDPDQLPYIIGIDGKQYPVPTFEQVITQLSLEDKRVIETIDEPKLLLSPFARSNLELGRRITSQSGNLARQNPLCSNWDQNADRTGDLIYRVNQFTNPVEGMTKQQILELPGDKNPFPGWNVFAVKGQPEIDRQAIVKKGGGLKNAHDFHEEYIDKKYDGLSPEDMFALHMLAMESGIPFDQENWCWLLDCYLMSAHAVPLVRWNGGDSNVFLSLDDPERSSYGPCSRGARRVGLGR